MKTLPLMILLLSLPLLAGAQTAKDTVMARWCGTYKGTLQIFGKNGKVDEVPMGLDIRVIKPDSLWQWEITYGSGDDADIRDYQLVAIDTARNYAYTLDEKDGILLSFYFVGKVFYSLFEVNGTQLTTFYSLGKDRISMQIITMNPARKDYEVLTGEGIHVSAFPPTGIQQAVLRKQ